MNTWEIIRKLSITPTIEKTIVFGVEKTPMEAIEMLTMYSNPAEKWQVINRNKTLTINRI